MTSLHETWRVKTNTGPALTCVRKSNRMAHLMCYHICYLVVWTLEPYLNSIGYKVHFKNVNRPVPTIILNESEYDKPDFIYCDKISLFHFINLIVV